MASDKERRLILEMIDEGKITAEEGLRLLQAVETLEEEGVPHTEETNQSLPELQGRYYEDPGVKSSVGASPQPQPEVIQKSSPTSLPPEAERWRRWWHIPLWIGVGITALSGFWMATVLERSGMNFWFFFAWLPFLLGILVIVLAWESRTSRWLHLRIQQEKGEWPQRIVFSMPLPLGLASWFLRNFKDKIPPLKDSSVDELILALGETATPDNPLFIEVDEGEDGEKVQIYIG